MSESTNELLSFLLPKLFPANTPMISIAESSTLSGTSFLLEYLIAMNKKIPATPVLPGMLFAIWGIMDR